MKCVCVGGEGWTYLRERVESGTNEKDLHFVMRENVISETMLV